MELSFFHVISLEIHVFKNLTAFGTIGAQSPRRKALTLTAAYAIRGALSPFTWNPVLDKTQRKIDR